MEIDHVALAARSKADAEQVLDEAGLGIARGRTMPGLGLSNFVVPLTPTQFLEIHYPSGEAAAPDAPPLLEFETAALAAHPSDRLAAMAWLLAVDDESRLRELAAMNDEAVLEAPAEGPGFPPYLLVGFGANLKRRWLPVFIHWPEGLPPLPAEHRREPVGITRIDVSGPLDGIQEWCGTAPVNLRTEPGDEGPLRVEIAFADGTRHTLGRAV